MIKVYNFVKGEFEKVTVDARFPNGEVSLSFDPDQCSGEVQWFFDEDLETLSHLFLVVEELKKNYVRLKDLYIPYLPFLRMDRNEGSNRLVTGELIFEIIDNLGFKNVLVGDYHSPDNINYLENKERNSNWTVYSLVDGLIASNFSHTDDTLFLYPDKGAVERYSFEPKLGYADKVRSYKDGTLIDMKLHLDKELIDPEVETTIVIVDDIVSRGGTFVWLKDLLDEKLPKDEYPNIKYVLVTAHTENKVLEGSIGDRYSTLITTDSLGVDVKELSEYMDECMVMSSYDLMKSIIPEYVLPATTDDNLTLEFDHELLMKKLSKSNEKSDMEIALKLSEEVGEVSEALLSLNKTSGSSYKNLNTEDLQEELIDVIMVAKSLLYKLDVSNENYNNVFYNKLSKWENVRKDDNIAIAVEEEGL